MDEKTMVNDVLNSVKAELATYQKIITETQNLELRQTIQEIRNNDESFQYELLKAAQLKDYYKQENEVTALEIQNVKNQLQQ